MQAHGMWVVLVHCIVSALAVGSNGVDGVAPSALGGPSDNKVVISAQSYIRLVGVLPC